MTSAQATAFCILFPLGFLAVWLLICTMSALFSGWRRLAERFATTAEFHGQMFRMRSAKMRFAQYNGAINIGSGPEGLYLRPVVVFRFRHPALLIPWYETEVRNQRVLFFRYAVLMLGRSEQVPLRISERLAEQLREAAGQAWPGVTLVGGIAK